MLRSLDLFSGIGGFALGLERAGIETAAFCEVLEKPRHLLATHFPGVPIYDDVCTLTGKRLVADGITPDLLCGGFPCQDISFAGKGAGLAGGRSGLWFQIARLLRELRDIGRPVRYVVLENVSALLGRGLGTVLGDLAACGYDAEWDCIPASAVGAPHRRDRIWIVAYPRGVEHEGFGDAFRRSLAAGLSEAVVANAHHQLTEPVERFDRRAGQDERQVPGRCRSDVADADRSRLAFGQEHEIGRGAVRHQGAAFAARGWWSTEPDVGRVAHGVPARVDRLHGLGNAVVPEIPYRLGQAILAASARATSLVAA